MKDSSDTKKLLQYLLQHNPFDPRISLRNITTGISAEPAVNAHEGKTIGDSILWSIKGKLVGKYCAAQHCGRSCLFLFLSIRFVPPARTLVSAVVTLIVLTSLNFCRRQPRMYKAHCRLTFSNLLEFMASKCEYLCLYLCPISNACYVLTVDCQ